MAIKSYNKATLRRKSGPLTPLPVSLITHPNYRSLLHYLMIECWIVIIKVKMISCDQVITNNHIQIR